MAVGTQSAASQSVSSGFVNSPKFEERNFCMHTSRIGGSVVEYSPATRVARVRFPADASCFLTYRSLHSKFVIKYLSVVLNVYRLEGHQQKRRGMICLDTFATKVMSKLGNEVQVSHYKVSAFISNCTINKVTWADRKFLVTGNWCDTYVAN